MLSSLLGRERFRQVFAKSSVVGSELNSLIFLGSWFGFPHQLGAGVSQQWPATRFLPPQRKVMRSLVDLASIFVPHPESPWQSRAAQARGRVAPFVLFHGVLSDGGWCGDVVQWAACFSSTQCTGIMRQSFGG